MQRCESHRRDVTDESVLSLRTETCETHFLCSESPHCEVRCCRVSNWMRVSWKASGSICPRHSVFLVRTLSSSLTDIDIRTHTRWLKVCCAERKMRRVTHAHPCTRTARNITTHAPAVQRSDCFTTGWFAHAWFRYFLFLLCDVVFTSTRIILIQEVVCTFTKIMLPLSLEIWVQQSHPCTFFWIIGATVVCFTTSSFGIVDARLFQVAVAGVVLLCDAFCSVACVLFFFNISGVR